MREIYFVVSVVGRAVGVFHPLFQGSVLTQALFNELHFQALPKLCSLVKPGSLRDFHYNGSAFSILYQLSRPNNHIFILSL